MKNKTIWSDCEKKLFNKVLEKLVIEGRFDDYHLLNMGNQDHMLEIHSKRTNQGLYAHAHDNQKDCKGNPVHELVNYNTDKLFWTFLLLQFIILIYFLGFIHVHAQVN